MATTIVVGAVIMLDEMEAVIDMEAAHKTLRTIGAIHSLEGGGDVWIADGKLTSAQRMAILALRSAGAGPKSLTYGKWCDVTRSTRTLTHPIESGTPGISIPTFFVPTAALVLAGG